MRAPCFHLRRVGNRRSHWDASVGLRFCISRKSNCRSVCSCVTETSCCCSLAESWATPTEVASLRWSLRSTHAAAAAAERLPLFEEDVMSVMPPCLHLPFFCSLSSRLTTRGSCSHLLSHGARSLAKDLQSSLRLTCRSFSCFHE